MTRVTSFESQIILFECEKTTRLNFRWKIKTHTHHKIDEGNFSTQKNNNNHHFLSVGVAVSHYFTQFFIFHCLILNSQPFSFLDFFVHRRRLNVHDLVTAFAWRLPTLFLSKFWQCRLFWERFSFKKLSYVFVKLNSFVYNEANARVGPWHKTNKTR